MALQPLNSNDPRRLGLVRRVSVSPVPVDVSENASFTLSYTGTELTTVTKVLDGVTYTRTLTWAGGQLTAVSAWSV